MAEEPLSLSVPPTLAQSSDDASSVGSLPYFHSSDFAESSWTYSVGYYGVPSIGLAILALFHPLLFVAGAGVAAASYGVYEVCHNGKKSENEEQVVEGFIVGTTDPQLQPTPRCDVEASESFYTPTICTDIESIVIISPLKNEILTNEIFPGLTAREFFNVFLGNNAIFSFSEFQRKRGDLNIQYLDWIDQKRVLTFETPTKQIFGPTYAIARKDQQLVRNSKHYVVMESTTTLEKIPFCNTFRVCEQWQLVSTRDMDGKPTTKVTISTQVDFISHNPFESQIKAKSLSTMREVLGCWCKMAHEAVRLTHKRAEERKQRQDKEKPKNDNAIEVAYNDLLRSASVVGDPKDDSNDESDWEMDPMKTSPPKVTTKARRLSVQALRRSLSITFSKKFGSAM